ncbi:hypothetical protein H6F55_01285 [Phormidium sp. FACHB-322]|nr:hypothetical protein [Phormidium sp. FACHB-77]MBD2028624.1 hypothetical protein [Phormidium sp. FACHB-322]MBD2051732.1 hypothetical protein [Leptolyngbya sp. FACHB-60]
MTMKTRSIAAIALGLTAASMAALPMAANAQNASTDLNYVGAGVGISDDIGLSINSKFTVADNISVRPGVITDLDFNGDDGETVFLLPVTYDFNAITDNGRILPYVGAGLSVSTEGSTQVGPMLTGGVDYRITERIVANGGVNVSFYDNTKVNGSVGLGYAF